MVCVASGPVAIITNAMATTQLGEIRMESRLTAAPPELVSVLQSRLFVRSPVLQKLLLYLWENRDGELSEYAIAVDALGRDSSFDPATDATVRVTIGRLRQKLRDHYLEDGKTATSRFEIPLGSHRLVMVEPLEASPLIEEAFPLRPQAMLEPTPSIESVAVRPRRMSRAGWWIAGFAIALLVGTVSLLAYRFRGAPAQTRSEHSLLEMQPWNMIATGGKPLRIIVATPVFFSWQAQGKPSQDQRILVRDVGVNDFGEINKSPDLQGLSQRYGKPLLGQSYTVISDTFASITLARFLDRNGLGDQAEVLDRAGATLPAVQHDNIIALGTSATLTPFGNELAHMNFLLEPGDAKLTNRNPAKGEPVVIQAQQESAERGKWPGIIAVLPGETPNSVQILLIGRYTSALATFLTSRQGLTELGAALRSANSPQYFEAVVESEMSADRLVSQKLLMVRASGAAKRL